MKHKAFVTFVLIIIAVAVLQYEQEPILAHPGRTDSQGGHYDRSDGTYHFHNGGQSSGGGGGSLTPQTSPPAVSYEPKPTPRPTPQPTPAPTPRPAILKFLEFATFSLLGLVFVLFPAVLMGVGIVLCIWNGTIGRIRKIQKEKALYNESRQKYLALYGGKKLIELVEIPDGTSIGDDGLPKQSNADDWGPLYTRYKSSTGEKFHMPGCRYAQIKIHACRIPGTEYRPCSCCKAFVPNMGWFYEYKEIEKIKKRYNIE